MSGDQTKQLDAVVGAYRTYLRMMEVGNAAPTDCGVQAVSNTSRAIPQDLGRLAPLCHYP